MKNWIATNSCRREFMLNYFEEELINKVEPCCDFCGLDLHNYDSTDKDNLVDTKELTWKDYLAKILVNSELSE